MTQISSNQQFATKPFSVCMLFSKCSSSIFIAAKIRHDNRHFYEDENSDEGICVTNYLWYMMASGYVLSIMGLFTFFIVTYYWSQQYPVGYRIDMISIFKMTEYGMVDLSNRRKEIAEKKEKIIDLVETLQGNRPKS